MKKYFLAIIAAMLLAMPALAQGKKVKYGKYFVKVEATLYQASSIVYTSIMTTRASISTSVAGPE